MVSSLTKYPSSLSSPEWVGCLMACLLTFSIGCDAPESAPPKPLSTNQQPDVPKQQPQQQPQQQQQQQQQASQTTVQRSDVIATISQNPVAPHPESHRFTDAQLAKDHTIYVLAFDSITRHTYFLSHYRHLMSEDQLEAARNLVDSHKSDFAELANEREIILNGATDEADIQLLLKNNSIKVLLLSRKVRRGIMHNVYTKEQRVQYNQEYAATRKKRKLKAPAKK